MVQLWEQTSWSQVIGWALGEPAWKSGVTLASDSAPLTEKGTEPESRQALLGSRLAATGQSAGRLWNWSHSWVTGHLSLRILGGSVCTQGVGPERKQESTQGLNYRHGPVGWLGGETLRRRNGVAAIRETLGHHSIFYPVPGLFLWEEVREEGNLQGDVWARCAHCGL